MQIGHILLHEFVLSHPRTMTGVKLGGMGGEGLGRVDQPIVQGQLGKMESSDQYVGHEPSGDVQNSLV